MARKSSKPGEVNKSAEMRELLRQNPGISVSDALAALAKRGIKVHPTMYYFNKGKLQGKKARRKKARRMVANVTAAMTSNGPTKTSDVVATILKVKHLAAEVGGLKKLKTLIEALGD